MPSGVMIKYPTNTSLLQSVNVPFAQRWNPDCIEKAITDRIYPFLRLRFIKNHLILTISLYRKEGGKSIGRYEKNHTFFYERWTNKTGADGTLDANGVYWK